MTVEASPALDIAPSMTSLRRWRRFRRNAVQAAIVAAVLAALLLIGLAIHNGLARNGIRFSFAYLTSVSGIDISEGKTVSFASGWPQLVPYTSGATNVEALIAGLFNTLKVAVLALVLATTLGTLVGVGRLSTNWLIRSLCFGLVEFIRNTPLLIQLTFWYVAVVLNFPPIASAARLFGSVIVSRQGLFYPIVTAQTDASLGAFVALVTAALAIAGALALFRRENVRNGLLILSALALAVSVWLGFPLTLDHPVASRFRATGGSSISPEMAALLLAITVHSSAYLAETVRGAIESIHRGQWEASGALGLSRGQTLRDIVLPQVFRIVLPSFGNQYINLTKNTSLGIAIGYPDLFNVYGTVANQTGRSLEGILVVMATYLTVSWVISGAMNFANDRFSVYGVRR